MKQRALAILGIAAVVLVGLLAGWLMMRPPTVEVPSLSPDPIVPGDDVDPNQARSRSVHPPAVQPVQGPGAGAEEAVFALADHGGFGLVRCELPPGTEVAVDQLGHASLHEGTLSFAVASDEGLRMLPRPAPGPPPQDPGPDAPDAVLAEVINAYETWRAAQIPEIAVAWSGATAGEEAACTLRSVQDRVTVTIAVETEDGSPAARALIGTTGALAEADEHGLAEMALIRAPQTLKVVGRTGPSDLVARRRLDPVEGQRVVVQLPSATQSDDDVLGRRSDEIENDAEDVLRKLARAHQAPRLSAAARSQLQAWIEAEYERLDIERAEIDRMYESWGYELLER